MIIKSACAPYANTTYVAHDFIKGKHITRGNTYHCDLKVASELVICVRGNKDP